jgi:outer membrane protein OmpA-like peptidoglycan-associated protein
MGTRTSKWAAGVLLLWATIATNPAAAQPVAEGRNFSAERFRLSLDKQGILNAEWAEVPDHLDWDLSLWLGVADDPLAIYKVEDGKRSRVGPLVDRRVGGSVVIALGLFDWVQLGIDLPLVFYQTRPDSLPGVRGQLDGLSGFGMGAPRIAPKVRILAEAKHGVGLAFVPAFTLPSASLGEYIGQDGLLFEPEVVLSKRDGILRGAVNLGLRLRRPEVFANLAVDNEIFTHLGAGIDLETATDEPIELNASLSAASALASPFADRNQNHLEALLGATYDFNNPALGFVAGGLGLSQGHGTPDWRVLVGLRLSDHDHDQDKDGLPDDLDECPKQPEDKDQFEDFDGCPDPDNDQDGILDVDDGAPLQAEDIDGFQDADGVPDPDNDGDGVWDWDDACVGQAGPEVNLGCPDKDTDGDGLIDRQDRCHDQAEDKDAFEDDDGCPDPDNDEDGILDVADQCPNRPGPIEAQGCPESDTDGDGVVDRLDNCPTEPGLVSESGCKKKQLVVITGTRLDVLEKVYFSSARSRIRRRSYELLDNVAAVLKAHPEITKVQVQGHTDGHGSARGNLRLSQSRSEAVRKYLIKRGIEAGRLEAKGFGESEPIAPNQSKAGRADNRRVEFRILAQ